MILTCLECTTRYRFDEARIPDRGLLVRCKRCRSVFRAWREDQEGEPAQSGAGERAEPRAGSERRSAPGRKSRRSPSVPASAEDRPAPEAVTAAGAAAVASAGELPPAGDPAGAPADGSVPVVVAEAAAIPDESEIKRLTRIILSDICIYSPERAEQSIRDGSFLELYRTEIEEGRRMLRGRYPGQPTVIGAFEQTLESLLETKKKQLIEASAVG